MRWVGFRNTELQAVVSSKTWQISHEAALIVDSPHSSTHSNLTVVIATLGGPTLQATVNALNRGTIVPDEILVCIPHQEAGGVLGVAASNVTVLPTRCRGQVAQRIEGFKQARSQFVMQLDDDMQVDERCLERLISILRESTSIAVAPTLIDVATNEPVYRPVSRPGYVRSFYYWIMNGREGYRGGAIQKSGSPIGFVPPFGSDKQHEVEWLAGGCVMFHRNDLVLENYFPFSGKAYCEDVIHSHLLRRNGVRLLVDSQAYCGLEVIQPFDKGFLAFMRETRNDFVARKYFMHLSGRPLSRMYIFYGIFVFRYVLTRLARVVGRA